MEGGTAAAAKDLSYRPDTVHQIYSGVSQNAFCFLIECDGIPIGDCWLRKMNLPDVLKMYPQSLDVRRIDMSSVRIIITAAVVCGKSMDLLRYWKNRYRTHGKEKCNIITV
ncbi:hypothetical protein B6259_00800 [Ruminococcaceae bacterium CPB6]|nr:hypothetical protein B6259_00800 [Ruminococcaceae bacterium CPB6]